MASGWPLPKIRFAWKERSHRISPVFSTIYFLLTSKTTFISLSCIFPGHWLSTNLNKGFNRRTTLRLDDEWPMARRKNHDYQEMNEFCHLSFSFFCYLVFPTPEINENKKTNFERELRWDSCDVSFAFTKQKNSKGNVTGIKVRSWKRLSKATITTARRTRKKTSAGCSCNGMWPRMNVSMGCTSLFYIKYGHVKGKCRKAEGWMEEGESHFHH